MTVPGLPPAPLTGLVGREREIEEVHELLRAGRLLTLTGPGGIGKTRLARAIVERPGHDFDDGVAWAALGSLSEPESVPRRIAASLGPLEPAGGPLPELLAGELAERNFLLVLDDCEHLLDAVAGLTELLLGRCPGLTVLATSREALGIAGERAWLVPPLSLPDEAPTTVRELLESGAARLFMDRAGDVLPGFEVDEETAGAVAQICRRLDGIPLAVELAAARVRVLTPAQIADRLDDAFRLLTGGRRTDLPRHRTLRAAIDWSYELLTPPERLLLQRLSVFRAGCTLDAVEAVCSDSELPAAEILDPLAALVERSMVRMQEWDRTARYLLLETVRVYAAERLEELGPDAAEGVRLRHARHLMSVAENVAPRLERLEHTPELLARFRAEHDDFRAALDWAVTADPGVALRTAAALAWFWITAGHWREGARRLDAVLDASRNVEVFGARARALSGAGAIAYLLHDVPRAEDRYREAAELHRSLGEPLEVARSLGVLAQIQAESGDADGALVSVDEALEIARSGQSGWLLAWVLGCRGAVLRSLGRLEEADAAYKEAESTAHGEEGPSLWLLEAPLGRALVAMLDGDPRRAAVHALAAVRVARGMEEAWFAARALLACAAVAARGGDAGVAAEFLGAISAQRADDRPFLPYEERLRDDLMRSVRAGVEGAAFDSLPEGEDVLELGAALERAEAYLDRRVSESPVASPGVATQEDETSGAGPTLDVRALGPLEIYRDGLPLPDDAWRYAKPRELFLFLLCHPRGCTREQVGLAFWPDASSAQVKNNFHVALHRLRKVLGDPRSIVLEQDRYRIHRELKVDFDAIRFEEAVSAGLRHLERGDEDPEVLERFRTALSLYRGDFLESEGVGDWHQDRRDFLRRLFVRGQSALAEVYLAADRLEEAATAFQGVIGIDDLQEDAYRGLMVCRARTGDRTGALRLFQRLESVLHEELDTPPEPETVELADRLRRNLPV